MQMMFNGMSLVQLICRMMNTKNTTETEMQIIYRLRCNGITTKYRTVVRHLIINSNKWDNRMMVSRRCRHRTR